MARLVGVLGGTFDPPHIGHLILAEEGMYALELEKVLWVVTAVPPHKPDSPITPVADRVRMVLSAIEGNLGFELSDADLGRPGPHYAVDSIRRLRERNPEVEFAYLMGSDSLLDLPTWYQPSRLLEACKVLGVMLRPGEDCDLGGLELELPGIAEKVHFLDAPQVGISSRNIRRRVREGRTYRYLVPGGVAEIMKELRLYS